MNEAIEKGTLGVLDASGPLCPGDVRSVPNDTGHKARTTAKRPKPPWARLLVTDVLS